MPVIHLTTIIQAPAETVFDLSRSIDFHRESMQRTGEKAMAGKTSGLIEAGETVTWQARHWFKTRTLSVQITAMEPHHFFEDSMVEGDFASMVHKHHFKKVANGTIMIDLFDYQLPFGKIGKWTETLFMNVYMKRLLQQRNHALKVYAEGNKWKQFLVQPAVPGKTI